MALANNSILWDQDFTSACSTLKPPTIPDTKLLWMTSVPVQNFAYPSESLTDVSGETPSALEGEIPTLDFCNVTIALTHTENGADDTSYITIWLPPKDAWNNRYTATGGGGLAAGFEYNMVKPLSSGFASSFTDAGLTLNHTIQPNSAIWGLKNDGSLDETLLTNLGWRSIHDMAIACKDVISQFYDTPLKYSYFEGCSQGGRQGYAAAAKYPDLFDGILAAAPAMAMESIGPGALWPVVVMHNEGEVVPRCVLEAYEIAIREMCDPRDGVEDGVISDYDLLASCPGGFNTSTPVGEELPCAEGGNANTTITITDRHATVVRKILDGPIDLGDSARQYWPGVVPGATFSGIADTVFHPETGEWTPRPFPPAAGWLQNLVLGNASGEIVVAAAAAAGDSGHLSPTKRPGEAALNITNLSYAEYFAMFDESIELGEPYLGDKGIDLRLFHAAGGKLLSWVGLADQYLPPQNLFNFYDNVTEILGATEVNDFYRLFTAPGVGHCGGGTGAQPVDPLGVLVKWVEEGKVPETLSARQESESGNENGKQMGRELCAYPKKMVFRGGDLERAASWGCEEPREHGDEEEGEDNTSDEAASGAARGVAMLWSTWFLLPAPWLFFGFEADETGDDG
ncbi:Tannase/feruloyl esterase [Aspergillus undulatus]|uniref:Tannase/feruloyl esterase n=1 Tax=Aspergillus undulatus TaxID=1810928 RepID=UPI003CCD00DC